MRHQTKSIGQIILTFVVVWFLALRVVAQPLVLAAPEDGQIALCLNGQIVYVDTDTGLPLEDNEGLYTDPCPHFGVNTALELTANTPAFWVSDTQHVVILPTAPALQTHQAYLPSEARAPPLST